MHGFALLLLVVGAFGVGASYWCDDFPPFRGTDLGTGALPTTAPGVRLWNLTGSESLTPTCGQAAFFSDRGNGVRAIQSDHFERPLGAAWFVWTFVNSATPTTA